MHDKTDPAGKTCQKELVLKALTDPEFRKMLQTEPKKALGMRTISTVTQSEITLTLSMVKGIEA